MSLSQVRDQLAIRGCLKRKTWLEAEQQGSLVRIRRKTEPPEVPDNPPRGQCISFSAASRLNLLRLIARIDWQAIGKNQFTTLTYPDPKWFGRSRDINSDMHVFVRYIEERLNSKFAWLWRIEWKPRRQGKHKGSWAPHLHLLPVGLRWVHWRTVRTVWMRVLQWTEYVHTYVKMREGEHAARYAAKYAAKEEDLGSLVDDAKLERTPGRVWGLLRPWKVPYCPLRESGPLDSSAEKAAQAIGARRNERYVAGGFSLFANNAATVFDAIVAGKENLLDIDGKPDL